MTNYRANYDRPPEVGTVIRVNYQRHQHVSLFQLIAVEPYTRQTGEPSCILIWRETRTGKLLTTGLRSKGFSTTIPQRWQWADGMQADDLALVGLPGFQGRLAT